MILWLNICSLLASCKAEREEKFYTVDGRIRRDAYRGSSAKAAVCASADEPAAGDGGGADMMKVFTTV